MKLTVPGLVDFHTHVFEYHGHPGFNLNPDDIGVKRGTTTVVDQGGPGSLDLASFKKHIADNAKTHVQCFVSAYMCGGNPRGEMKALYSPDGMSVEKTVTAVRLYDPDLSFVRGIKVHCGPSGYDEWGVEPLKLARQMADELNLPLYVHLGSLWNFKDTAVASARIMDQAIDNLRCGDILAHPYRPENGFVSLTGEIHPMVKELRSKGILIDMGRGATVSFKNVQILADSGFEPDIISSDLHGYGKPQEHSLLRAMSEMLYFGMPVENIVRAVTETPGRYLKNLPEVTTDLEIVDEPTSFNDSTGATILAKQIFKIVQKD
jgi:dihydroorotase